MSQLHRVAKPLYQSIKARLPSRGGKALERNPLLPLLLTILLLAPSIFTFSSANSATSNSEWHVIVMPYLAQDAPIDIRGYAGVFLYSYGFLEAVIDLNHNGVPDPGEPVINITAKDRLVYASIGYGMAYKSYYRVRHGDGPLWILVRHPVVASFIAYSARNGYMAAYTMPPPGRFFITPGIPGNLYIAPTTPGKTSIDITYPDGSVKHYVVDSSQYLLVNDRGQALQIKADKPVAIVLVNLNYGNNASYATELVPLEYKWVPPYGISAPFPEMLITKTLSSIGFTNIKSFLYLVYSNGTVAVWEYREPIVINMRKEPYKIAYVLVEAKRGNTYATDIVPLYNMVNWWHILGANESIPILLSFSLYTGYHDRVSLLDIVANIYSTPIWVISDYNRDFKGDKALAVELTSYEESESHALLVAPWGKRLNVNIYADTAGIYAYSIVANRAKGSLLARLITVPIPLTSIGDYKPYDSYLRNYGPESAKGLVLSLKDIGIFSLDKGYDSPGPYSIRLTVELEPDKDKCSTYHIGLAILSPDMNTVASKLIKGCKAALEANLTGKNPPMAYTETI